MEKFNKNREEKIQELIEAQIAASMDIAYEKIEQLGPTDWIRQVNFPREKTRRILTNMINWFASEPREEYEKAALIQKTLSQI